jgi:ABC-type molybdate transport system substrate-binding protein
VSADGLRAVINDLRPKFEAASGHKLAVTYTLAGAAVKRVQDGEAADVIITSSGVEALLKDGKTAPGDVAVIARSGRSSAPTVFSAVILAGARDPQAAKAFVKILHSPEAAGVIKAKGLQPGRWRDEREAPAGQNSGAPKK